MKIKGRDTKPISAEDREVFDWIGQKLQDIHDGKDPYLTDEEVERDRQEWLKTQTPSEKLQDELEPIIHEDEDKDEDEVGEEPATEEERE
jgi:nucleotidyltransferase/DNA polymerase involved in DNA repair